MIVFRAYYGVRQAACIKVRIAQSSSASPSGKSVGGHRPLDERCPFEMAARSASEMARLASPAYT